MPDWTRPRNFFDDYTRGLTRADVERLFTRDTPEAYRFFARGLDLDALATQPWYRRWPMHARLMFVAFTMKLSPARRLLFALALVAEAFGLLALFRGFAMHDVLIFPMTITMPVPQWTSGTLWLITGFLAINLLVLMEVADRLSLKGDLEIARDIQLAMLPSGVRIAGDAIACGSTRPANTVGGDFYDILPLPDGRLIVTLGDVAGKGSPAALLMALLLAMMRTLVDEGLESVRLAERLNVQIARHSPSSRFITLFYAVYDPRDGSLDYVNAGHLPPVLRRADGTFERVGVGQGGMALGMFDHATYESHRITLGPGDLVVLFSDGITEAEDAGGHPFDDAGLERTIAAYAEVEPDALGVAILKAVERHSGDRRLADDLTTLVLKRSI